MWLETMMHSAVALLLGVASVGAAAQVMQPFDRTAPSMSQVLPVERTQGSVSYITGGVTIDERDSLRQMERQYPLTIELASPGAWAGHDPYQAEVRVDIRDQQGARVLQTMTDGPFLLAALPPGRYTVTAEVNGRQLQRTLDIGNAPQHVLMEFSESGTY